MDWKSKKSPIILPKIMVNQSQSLFNPLNAFQKFWKYRDLIWELTKREIQQQYQGSYIGFVWTVIVPLMMLLIYTFVFSVVFQARWSGATENTPPQEFALILFAGLTPFNVFSAVVNRSPGLIINVPNYVKKVIFPLEILPIVVLGSALFTSLIYIALILIGNVIVYHSIPTTIIFLPLAYLPLVFLCLGLSWFVSSLGVFIRDIGQGVVVVVQVLFFMTPIFYPATSVPESMHIFLSINPLTAIVDFFRSALLGNQPPNWLAWGQLSVATILFALLGYVWFMKTKKGFADVL